MNNPPGHYRLELFECYDMRSDMRADTLEIVYYCSRDCLEKQLEAMGVPKFDREKHPSMNGDYPMADEYVWDKPDNPFSSQPIYKGVSWGYVPGNDDIDYIDVIRCAWHECGDYVQAKFVDIYCVVSIDGYLFAATENEEGCNENYYPNDYFYEYDEEDDESKPSGTEIILVRNVPQDLADAACDIGTSGQIYSDGYEAWQEILKNKHTEVPIPASWEFTGDELARMDKVDNAIFRMMGEVMGSETLPWDIEQIAKIREAVQEVICNEFHWMTERQFYPYRE